MLLEFDTMNEKEMYRMVHEIYGEASYDNAKWRHPELDDLTEAIKDEEQYFINFLKKFFQKKENRYYLLEMDGKWVSALRMTSLDDFYYLESLETAKEYRKLGYAAMLINEVILLLKKRGSVVIRDNVKKTNLASLAVHKKCKFIIDEENGINYLTGEQSDTVYGMLYME